MFTKKTDLEYLETWRLLFETEGSFCGKVRDVFDQSFQRFVDAIILHRCGVEERRQDAGIKDWVLGDCDETEDQIRHIMMARLPLFGYNDSWLKGTYAVLHNKERIQKGGIVGGQLYGTFIYACQTLRVGLEVTDAMKERIFTPLTPGT